MASIKLLRDEKTGNVYECLISDKGEIVQEHFIPSSEVSKHPKFTAPLEVKNIYNYFIPELIMKNPKTNTVITNTANEYINSNDLSKLFNQREPTYKEYIKQETLKKEFNKNILIYFPIASLVVYLLYLAIENM